MKHYNHSTITALIRKNRTLLAAVTILLLAMFSYEIYDHWEEARENALIVGRSFIEKDITYRKWNAMHGGVYVPITEKTPSNPYLSQNLERDITTPSGRRLTLVNPAYMTRQVHELEGTLGGISHITSLKLLRPENKSDLWESKALEAFEKGASEVSSVEVINGKKYMRVMLPLNTDKPCLKCHAVQGYKEGDIRGAISASIPMDSYYASALKSMLTEGFIYLVCWLLTSGLILLWSKRVEENRKALSHSEKRYRALFTRAEEGIFILSPDGQLVDVNESFAKMHGFTVEEMKKMHLNDLDTPETARLIPERMKRVMAGEHLIFEVEHYHKDGHIFPLEVSASLLSYDDKSHIQCFHRDITERKRIEAEKNIFETELRHSQKMESIGTFAGGVAHDFNNILSGIQGFGYIALMKLPKDDPSRFYIDQILKASERAAHLTRDLVTFSRKQISNRKTIDLNEIIRKISRFLSRIIGEDILFETSLSQKSIPILADENQIGQVMMNLATNAKDAMLHGGTFTITTNQIFLTEAFSSRSGSVKPGMYVLLSVADTGHGMDLETAQRIFEPFFTTKEVGKGTGLGLSVVYSIIKQHEGHIDVYSESGKGTTFKIYLPLSEVVSAEQEPEAVERPVGGTETILLAEDDETVRNLTVSVLNEFGYTVITALNGEDAITKFNENNDRIQLLIFDLIMPKKNGKQAYDEIRKIRSDMKVIFASGYSRDVVEEKMFLESDSIILSKPINPLDLLRKVRSLLDGRAA